MQIETSSSLGMQMVVLMGPSLHASTRIAGIIVDSVVLDFSSIECDAMPVHQGYAPHLATPIFDVIGSVV
eukprot:5567960-Pyramimonas_sp.AAC.1